MSRHAAALLGYEDGAPWVAGRKNLGGFCAVETGTKATPRANQARGVRLNALISEPPSAALNPPAATIPLPFLLAGESCGDTQLSPLPESVDLGGEVLGKEGGVEDQQGFVVLVGG